MNKLKLDDIVNAIEFYSDECQSFIDIKNNEVCIISEEALSIVENNGYYPEWQHDDILAAKAYLEDENRFKALPAQHDADEYRMMRDFSSSLDDSDTQEKLFAALQGRGVFRRFKDTVIILGIDSDWYRYRDERYRQFCLEWCKDNQIEIDVA